MANEWRGFAWMWEIDPCKWHLFNRMNEDWPSTWEGCRALRHEGLLVEANLSRLSLHWNGYWDPATKHRLPCARSIHIIQDSSGPTAPGQERAGFTDSAHDPEKLRILLQVLRAMNVWGRAWGWEDPQGLQSVPGTGTDVGFARCWMIRSVVIVHNYMGEKNGLITPSPQVILLKAIDTLKSPCFKLNAALPLSPNNQPH